MTFDDLAHLDDRSIQEVVRVIKRDKWAIALKTAPDDVCSAVMRNMSARAVDCLRDEINVKKIKKRHLEQNDNVKVIYQKGRKI